MDRVTDIAWKSEMGALMRLATLRYRFQGRELSAATGLVHFRNRWYDGETGRWLSKDPIRLSGGLNLYAFCGNDPVNCTDSLGLKKDNKKPKKPRGPKWHHENRRKRNTQLPPKPPKGNGWRQLPGWQSVYHDNGDEYPEKKFVNDDGREAVYDGKTDELITDDELGGTYNYVNPPQEGDGVFTTVWRATGHFVADMLPYYIWGN